MTKRALVLGGGGSVGIAWETGLAAGLADEGIDLRLADKIIGTSAGSFVGAELASGRSPGELRARLTEGARARAGQGSTPTAMPVPDLTRLMEFMVRVPKDEAEALKLRAEIGAYALEAATIPEEACIGFFASVADMPWPAKYSCTAVDAQNGRFVVLDRSTGTSLARGVASSCSVPGLFPPITINGRRYYDGGIRSATNFDLAEGYERVDRGGGDSAGRRRLHGRAHRSRTRAAAPQRLARGTDHAGRRIARRIRAEPDGRLATSRGARCRG